MRASISQRVSLGIQFNFAWVGAILSCTHLQLRKTCGFCGMGYELLVELPRLKVRGTEARGTGTYLVRILPATRLTPFYVGLAISHPA